RVPLLHEDRRAAGNLRQRTGGRRDHRSPRRHRLDDGEAEALVPGREDEARRSPVERGELLLGHVAAELDTAGEAVLLDGPLRVDPSAVILADDDEPRRAVAQQRQRLDRGTRVLAWLERADEERVGLAVRARALGGEGGIDAVRGDDDLLRGNVVELDQV